MTPIKCATLDQLAKEVPYLKPGQEAVYDCHGKQGKIAVVKCEREVDGNIRFTFEPAEDYKVLCDEDKALFNGLRKNLTGV